MQNISDEPASTREGGQAESKQSLRESAQLSQQLLDLGPYQTLCL